MTIVRIDTKEEIEHYNMNGNSLVVVIDTCMFASSVISLFDCNVDSVRVFEEWKEVDFPFGGEGEADFDFGNFPQSIYSSKPELENENVGIVSDNGSVACHKVMKEDNLSEIILASSINMQAVSNYVSNSRKEDIFIVQSGSHNNFQLEDSITSGLIGQYLRDIDHDREDLFENQIKSFISEYYPWVPEEDVERLSDFNSYNIVPVSKGYYGDYIEFNDINR
jgi:phosphosulfolactate phosphohydrolase-like enzyme